MSDNAKNQSISQSASSEPSAARRKLLRAAAVSAPFIATLPSGAALAMASASQCMITSRESSQGQFLADGTEFAAKLDTDQYLRVHADGVRYTQTDTANISNWFLWDERWYRAGDDDRDKWTKNAVTENGVTIVTYTNTSDSTTISYPSNEWSEENRGRWLLVLVRPDSSGTGDPAYPSGFTDVTQWPADVPGGGDTGLMGITGTCACSVAPGLTINTQSVC